MLRRSRHAIVVGGGAALTAAPGVRAPRTFSFEEITSRSDALALRLGTKATASAVLLACVVVILIGARSMLASLEGVDRDMKVMNEQLAMTNVGLDMLNESLVNMPATAANLDKVVASVEGTRTEVNRSTRDLGSMAKSTEQLSTQIGAIASSTTSMRESLEGTAGSTETLATTIGELDRGIVPLVATQQQMLGGTKRMRGGLDGMNASLATVVRQLSYIARPPSGGGLTVGVELPKETLPPIPGLKATVAPLQVFRRDVWPVYEGR